MYACQQLHKGLFHHKSTIQEDDARVDIRAAGFWGHCRHRPFFDVRVFNAFAESNQSPCPAVTFQRHEGDKHRAYEECVCEVEPGSFTPLVFSSGDMHGRSVTVTYRHLASLLSVKWNSPYPVIMGWLHCSLGFSLLRSALMCLHGSQSQAGSPGVPAAVDLAVAEGHLATNDVNFLTTSVGSCRYLFCWSEFPFFK